MTQNPAIFDPTLLRARQKRANALGPVTFLIERVAEEMGERLGVVLRQFERAADFGTPAQHVRDALMASGKAGVVTALHSGEGEQVVDGLGVPLAPGSLDLVVSGLAFQFANDLPGTLIQLRRALKPDGLLLAAMLGGDTLTELRQAFAQAESEVEGGMSPRVAPFADLRDVGALLQRAGFALPVVDADRVVVRYDSVLTLMQELRHMGATNAMTERRKSPLRRATLMRMVELYAQKFSDDDGRVRATFEIIWLSGWVPHESQQKPLKPGSASHRLADALGAREIPSGEKPGG